MQKNTSTTAGARTQGICEINIHRLGGDESGYEASTRILRDYKGRFFSETGETAEEAMRQLADAICGNNPSSDASVTYRSFVVIHDERKSQEIYSLYEVTRIDGGRGSICYEVVTQADEEAFLESFVDRLDEYDVKLLLKNLPRQFALGPQAMAVLRGFLAGINDRPGRDEHEWFCTNMRPLYGSARSIVAKVDGQ